MVHGSVRPERDRGRGVPAVEGGSFGSVSWQAASLVPGQRVAHVVAGG